MQDDYIWTPFVDERNFRLSSPSLRKWAATVMIIFGVIMLWQNFSELIYRFIPDNMWDILAPIVQRVPEVVIAFLLIYAGLHMIKGKKEELDGDCK